MRHYVHFAQSSQSADWIDRKQTCAVIAAQNDRMTQRLRVVKMLALDDMWEGGVQNWMT